MRNRRLVILILVLPFLTFARSAWAQQSHVVDHAALQQAITQRVAEDQSDRTAIVNVLQRDDVQKIAAHMGMNLERAKAAVATLSDSEAHQLAASARAVDANAEGGSSTVYISLTTLLLLLILVVLIAK